jgi:hypothetical protein
MIYLLENVAIKNELPKAPKRAPTGMQPFKRPAVSPYE